MSPKQKQDDVIDAFQESYQLVVDQMSRAEPVWPPSITISHVTQSPAPARSRWKVGVSGFLLTVAFGLGWLLAPSPVATDLDSPNAGAVPVASTAIPETASAEFASAADAAIASAITENPSLTDPHVTRLIAIGASDTSVNLRAQVVAGEFCHWCGVGGRVRDGALVWSAAPASACSQ